MSNCEHAQNECHVTGEYCTICVYLPYKVTKGKITCILMQLLFDFITHIYVYIYEGLINDGCCPNLFPPTYYKFLLQSYKY